MSISVNRVLAKGAKYTYLRFKNKYQIEIFLGQYDSSLKRRLLKLHPLDMNIYIYKRSEPQNCRHKKDVWNLVEGENWRLYF
jgi:hypothetical protein